MSPIARCRWCLLLGGGLLLAGCPPVKPAERTERPGESPRSTRRSDDERAAVVVGDEEVTRREVERRLQTLPEYARVQYRTTEKKKTYLQSIAQFEILADVAERRRFGEAPVVGYEMEGALVRDHLNRVLQRDDVSMQSIDEEAIQRRFRREYREPTRRRAAVIAARDRSRLEAIREDLNKKSHDSDESRIRAFRRAASRYSNHSSTSKGGYVGLVRPPDSKPSDPALAEAIYALEHAGEVSPIFKYDDRWAIATYYGRKPATELEMVSREIRTELYEERRRERRRQLIEQWRGEVSITKRQDVLEELTPPDARRTSRLDEVPVVEADEASSSP